jgi:uncharacterized protein YndB with AHSA1/START domain
MEQKTKLTAEADRQELLITRTFDLPLNLLYKAYAEAELIEQWMGNKVVKLEHRSHGSYAFETTDAQGNVLFRANGTFHKVIENQTIVRTFEMDSREFPVQLEYLDFEEIGPDKSSLSMKIIFKSVADRDNLLKLPFAYGINMAHNALQKLMQQFN